MEWCSGAACRSSGVGEEGAGGMEAGLPRGCGTCAWLCALLLARHSIHVVDRSTTSQNSRVGGCSL